MQISYETTQVQAGNKTGITNDSFQEVQNWFFLLRDNKYCYFTKSLLTGDLMNIYSVYMLYY